MNTQRPEWNDANNAIVGNGLSMVTVYQMYRHLQHCLKLAENLTDVSISTEVKAWFIDICQLLNNRAELTPRAYLDTAGEAFSKYRSKIYTSGFSGKEAISISEITAFCKTALETLAETIDANKRPDGMYHSYNILTLTEDSLKISNMFLMLEGQTAVLGSGCLGPAEALELTHAMEHSDLLNKQLGQFFLYPVKQLDTFIERNIIPRDMAEKSPTISGLLKSQHEGFVLEDADGQIRFHDSIQQSSDVNRWLERLEAPKEDAAFIHEIYEHVFAHKQFTGRSGIMYKYEGIGSIYWHQNSKFMLSFQEVFTKAAQSGEGNLPGLKEAYYRLYDGFGFRKTPEQWGAFPLEPYSHTPYGMPAQQPGMTGQVKEDILTRFAELGVMVKDGVVSFDFALLRKEEFLTEDSSFRYVDVNNQYRELALPANSLAFTICQVPVVYVLGSEASVKVVIDKKVNIVNSGLKLSEQFSNDLFSRSGVIERIEVTLAGL